MKATVVKGLGPVSYLVFDGVRQRVVHVDHLLYAKETDKETSGYLMEDTCPAEDPASSMPDGTAGGEHPSEFYSQASHSPSSPAKEIKTAPLSSPLGGSSQVPPETACGTQATEFVVEPF